MKISMPMRYLSAAALFCSGKSDLRHHLWCVRVRDGSALATDGHALLCIESQEIVADGEYLILADDARELAKAKLPQLEIAPHDDNPNAGLGLWRVIHSQPGPYSSTDTLVAAAKSSLANGKPEPGHYNPHLLTRFWAAAKILLQPRRGQSVGADLHQRGPTGMAPVTIYRCPEVLGIVMPMHPFDPGLRGKK